jgi:hypothetical protein
MRRFSMVALACLAVSGCSFLNDAIWPTLSGAQPPQIDSGQAGSGPEVTPAQPAPLFDGAPFNASLAQAVRPLRSIDAKLPNYATRLSDTQAALAARAKRVESPPAIPDESTFDRWASAQIELSRLNDDIVDLDILREDLARDAANIAVAVAQLTALGQVTDIPDDESQRLTGAGQQANAVLVRVGRLQQALAQDHQRWKDYAQAQTDRIGVRQAGTILEPSTPSTSDTASNTGTTQVVEAWPASGNRFKGRKPLMSVNLSDPEIAYKDELRDLMQRVQTQYPDIAFDIEVVGADRTEVDSVIQLLGGMTIEAQAFRTLQQPGDAPIMRLFPR